MAPRRDVREPAGGPYPLGRAVDEHGAAFDVLLQKPRDKAPATRLSKRVPRTKPVRHRIVTDQRHSEAAAKAELPALTTGKHAVVTAAGRVNHRREDRHQPAHEQRMRRFPNPTRTQAFLLSVGPVRQHFGPKRDGLGVRLYRKPLAGRCAAWRAFTHVTPIPSAAF